jgi:hypothetical protein
MPLQNLTKEVYPQILASLARGAAEARLTPGANAALQRLTAKESAPRQPNKK